MLMKSVYLDNNSTTAPLPEVVSAVASQLETGYANPSSTHQAGQEVRHAIESARAQVAGLIHASPKCLTFTSGGTESINLALRGIASAVGDRRKIVTTGIEHSAVLNVCESLGKDGWQIVCIDADSDGSIDIHALADAIDDDTALVSIQHVNHETGVVQDVANIGEMARERGSLVHVDAVQSAGKLPIDVTQWPVDMLSISAHKIHGPKGVGALYVRRRLRIDAQILGGLHESGLRGGTENTAGIVGFGVAAEAARHQMQEWSSHSMQLRDKFEAGIRAAIADVTVFGGDSLRVGHTSYIGFQGVMAEGLLILLSDAGISASAGAACSSGSLEPSHVLGSMGVDDTAAHGAVRFSFSHLNTTDEVDYTLSVLPTMVSKLVALAGG